MKRLLFALLIGLHVMPGAFASLSLENVQSGFIEGKQHYESQKFDLAIERYQTILQAGYYAPELFHNLGNAYFRNGDIGRAILNFRRANRLAPMDSAIQANLQFAQKQTGAVIPPTPIWHAPIQVLPQRTWLLGLIASWWACMLGLSAWFWFGRSSMLLKRVWASLAGLVVLFAAGYGMSVQLEQQREVVILADKVEALFAPLPESVAHFSLPEGSVAAMVEQGERWMKIKSGKDSGWIPANSCESVYPWQ